MLHADTFINASRTIVARDVSSASRSNSTSQAVSLNSIHQKENIKQHKYSKNETSDARYDSR